MRYLFFLCGLLLSTLPLAAQTAGTPDANDLIIAQNQTTTAMIVVAEKAGTWEKQAALDLQKYIELMSGVKIEVASTPEAIAAAMNSQAPVFLFGSQALNADPTLQQILDKVGKKNPFIRGDAIALRRAANRVLLAGTNDESHYFAVTQLLHSWGCRWYLPGEFGEVVPSHAVLRVGQLEYSYAPPFEIRRALNRGAAGFTEFDRRNFMSSAMTSAHMGSLHLYIKDLIPEGKTFYNVPLSADSTAQHIADKLADRYAANVNNIPVAPFTDEYSSEDANDTSLRAGIISKYQDMVVSTDAFMTLLNKVAKRLREKYPQSKTKIIGLAMASTFLPPQHAFKPEPNLMMWLVPVDTDPNHAMNDPRSPSRQEWREIVRRWSKVMEGRVAIYDYEEAMLVWRNLPNPRQHVFRNDFKEFRDAGILGFSPETRGSLAVNFLNVYLRAWLMWNPDVDIDALLNEFYPNFYGPAAAPMRDYHRALFKAWEDTIVTEHEHFIAPAIYTPQLVNELRAHLEAAEVAITPLQNKADLNRNEKLYLERLKIARLGFDILDDYMASVRAAATECDYKAAVEAGKRGLASTLALSKFNPTYTPEVNAKLATLEPGGNVAHFPGEVAQYQKFQRLTDGTNGVLIVKTPLEWAFRRDPNDTGLASGFAYQPVDLSYWNENKEKYSIESRKDYPTTEWEMLRTDLYMQTQGVRHPDNQSYTGHAWYRTEVDLSQQQANNKVQLMFPGLFNECWLYVNGVLIAHRPQKSLWALNDYAFEWDVDLSGHLRPGANTITLRLHNPMYMGGIFRRPFLYQPTGG